jgi:hypothetical protein
VAGDLGHQAGNRFRLDIGGVGQHHVEPSGERRCPVGAEHGAACSQAGRPGVAGGQRGGFGQKVDADPEGCGEFDQRCQQQAAGAGAQVEDAPHRGAVGAGGDGGGDQGFAVGAGDQGGGRDLQLEGPERLLADQEGERLAGGAAGDQGAEGAGVAGGVFVQPARLAAGGVDAGGAEQGGGLGEGVCTAA